MGSTIDKLNKVQETKAAIKAAIIAKGVDVSDDTIFADYPNKISEITSGEGSGEELVGDYVILRFDSNLNDTSDLLKKSSEVEFNFDVSNVTNMESMFYSCESLESLDLSNFNTSNVTNMRSMFYSCESLESLDLSNFNTSNVESMYDMFSECKNLKELNLSNFEVREDCDVDWMLNNCKRLHTLRLDNCNEGTVEKIITSKGFPTGTISGVTRTIYCKRSEAYDLEPPTNWVFSLLAEGDEE